MSYEHNVKNQHLGFSPYKYSIALLLPYFGKFPSFFPLWLQSCVDNPTIDFYIFTDQHLVCDKNNIHIINTSLQEIKQKIEKWTGFEVNLEKAYKLCDFRPIYDKIFSDITANYDYWGWCDCDMILGNIRNFFTDDYLDRFHYIGAMGPFHIQRTHCDHCSNIYEKAIIPKLGVGYKEIFQSSVNHIFDELPNGVPFAYLNLYPEEIDTLFTPEGRCYDSITNVYPSFVDTYNFMEELGEKYQKTMYYTEREKVICWKNRVTKGEYKKYVIYKYNQGELYRIFWKNGTIMTQKELLYAHFFKRPLEIQCIDLNRFFLIPNKIIAPRSLNLSWIKKEFAIFYTKYLCHKYNRLIDLKIRRVFKT